MCLKDLEMYNLYENCLIIAGNDSEMVAEWKFKRNRSPCKRSTKTGKREGATS